MKNFVCYFLVMTFVFVSENIFSQCEMLTDDGGRTYYTSCEDGELNITDPPVSSLTITDYEMMFELIVGGVEVQSTRVFGDANHNGLAEMYVPIFKTSVKSHVI